MNNKWFLSALCVLTLAPALWAIPSAINYQGTLKEKGVPSSGTKQMIFRITDKNGTQVYWSSGQIPVTVTNGLFSTQITPTGVPWETVTPYIEVSVEGQLLLPREPVNATVYAVVSSSIVDGAITPAKVTAGYGLVPSGMIAMFAATCPAGWTLFPGLQGHFPVGADPANPAQFTAGQSGGSLTHNHAISSDGVHNHGGATTGPNQNTITGAGQNAMTPTQTHTHGISMDGGHNHGGATGNASSLPPYMSVVFCQKL